VTTAGRQHGATVAVVITTFNHARFLSDAILSALNQTSVADEIIVVDDGSEDHPEQVVAQFDGVRLIRQSNQGLCAARNTGLSATQAKYVCFLDADDMLLPKALELGRMAYARLPTAAFVYGGHRRVDEAGRPISDDIYRPVGSDPFDDFLLVNVVGMHATALFDRSRLAEIGGYDIKLRCCEDYDVFLRLARHGAVLSYPDVVALYRIHDRIHGTNMSRNRKRMARTATFVLDRHAADAPEYSASAAEGRRFWKTLYSGESLKDAQEAFRGLHVFSGIASVAGALQISPGATGGHIMNQAGRALKAVLPPALRNAAKVVLGRRVPKGWWRFGNFDSTRPASRDFGWDRGEPVDRYYVEAFLARNSRDIRGRVLEIGDDSYSKQFGGAQITTQDILHVHAGNERATIIGDLSQAGVLPDDTFDCIVLTQTLHLVYDMAAGVRNLHRSLRPGGVLLLTSPGISQVDRGEWGANWFWSITPAAAKRLLGDVFGDDAISVEQFGNIYAAVSFLTGLARDEVSKSKLDEVDEAYPVIVTVRAVKK